MAAWLDERRSSSRSLSGKLAHQRVRKCAEEKSFVAETSRMTASPFHVVLVGWGSSGDVLPVITIGGELRRRGHVVTFVGNEYFSSAARAESLRVVQVG